MANEWRIYAMHLRLRTQSAPGITMIHKNVPREHVHGAQHVTLSACSTHDLRYWPS